MKCPKCEATNLVATMEFPCEYWQSIKGEWMHVDQREADKAHIRCPHCGHEWEDDLD
jgi:hypothetical protein